MPPMTNDQITAGPATGTACDRMKKIPVPSVPPTPIMVSEKRPMLRLRCPSSDAVVVVGFLRSSC